MKKEFGTNLLGLSREIPKYSEGYATRVQQVLNNDGFQDPWMHKFSALYWQAYLDFDPKYICIRRNIDSVVNSNMAVGLHRNKWNRDEMVEIMQAHNDQMDYVVEHHGGVNVFTEELIQGDYVSLEKALKYCGIKMKKDIVDDFIERKYWHY
jgi:hypothetical protein